MQKIYSFLSNRIKFVFCIIIAVFLLGMLFIRSLYQWDDSPSFSNTRIIDYLMLIFNACILTFIYKKRYWLEKHLNFYFISAVYILFGILFIILVPLKPFSDMEYIYQASLEISYGNFDFVYNSDYFNTYPNNLIITYLYGFLFFIFPKSYITIKLLNLFATILIAYITVSLAKQLFFLRFSNLMYLGIYSFFSIFLYINHIYTDTIFTLLSLLSIYIYVVNKKYLLLSILILAISYFIRPVSAIYLIAILIIELFDTSSIYRKKLFRITSSILLFIAIYGLFQYGIDKQLKHKELRIPAASYLYMGFNQEEFGFQDNRHSTTLTLSDVKERISSYSFVDVLNIITKKAYWTWTEGTFQAERYAFGNAVENETEKFQYSTFITKYIKNPTQKAYKYLESFMRAQYYYLLLFALIGAFIVRKKRNFDIIFLLFVGFFIFYLFWEIKSRYLISLYPFYFIFSFNCISRNK